MIAKTRDRGRRFTREVLAHTLRSRVRHGSRETHARECGDRDTGRSRGLLVQAPGTRSPRRRRTRIRIRRRTLPRRRLRRGHRSRCITGRARRRRSRPAFGFYCQSDADLQCAYGHCINGHCGGCSDVSQCKRGTVCAPSPVGGTCWPDNAAGPAASASAAAATEPRPTPTQPPPFPVPPSAPPRTLFRSVRGGAADVCRSHQSVSARACASGPSRATPAPNLRRRRVTPRLERESRARQLRPSAVSARRTPARTIPARRSRTSSPSACSRCSTRDRAAVTTTT